MGGVLHRRGHLSPAHSRILDSWPEKGSLHADNKEYLEGVQGIPRGCIIAIKRINRGVRGEKAKPLHKLSLFSIHQILSFSRKIGTMQQSWATGFQIISSFGTATQVKRQHQVLHYQHQVNCNFTKCVHGLIVAAAPREITNFALTIHSKT